jgi:hypothetical protein
VSRATGVDQPKSLHASHLQNKNESESEQTTQHWGEYKMNQTNAVPFYQKWG